MSIFSSHKKIFLLGFIVVILLAIPLSVYVARQRQQTKTQAAKSTVLSFEPANPTVKVGEILTLNVMLDPGTGSSANQVSFVKLSITFDSEKFTTAGASLKPNLTSNNLNTVLEDAEFEEGKASISLSIGADPTKAVVTKTKIAILKLKATATATSTPVTFDDNDSQVLSIASSDGTSENVLLNHIPANVTISNTSAGTAPTTAPSNPNPTTAPGQPSAPTATPKSQSSSSQSSFGSSGGISGISGDIKAPICSSLSTDDLTTGTVPYTLTFVATGSDSDGIINKISFNFGDSIEDLTVGGGIGTSTVSGQISHTYDVPGVYTAYAILTDNDGNLSTQQDSCTKTITINSDLGLKSDSTIIVQEPLPPTGDGKTMFGLGILGAIFTIIGTAFFILL